MRTDMSKKATLDSTRDPCGLLKRGFRFIIRGRDAAWRNPAFIRPGDVDVTDVEDIDELAAICVREGKKAGSPVGRLIR